MFKKWVIIITDIKYVKHLLTSVAKIFAHIYNLSNFRACLF